MDETKPKPASQKLDKPELHGHMQSAQKAMLNNDWEASMGELGKVLALAVKELNAVRKRERLNTVYTVSGAVREFCKIDQA